VAPNHDKGAIAKEKQLTLLNEGAATATISKKKHHAHYNYLYNTAAGLKIPFEPQEQTPGDLIEYNSIIQGLSR